MNRSERKYLILLAVTLLLLVLMEVFGPKETDFSLDFRSAKDIPYGCSAFKTLIHDQLDTLVPVNHRPFYNLPPDVSCVPKTYLIVTNQFQPDALDISVILRMVADGNNFLISSLWFSQEFLDTIHLKQNISVNLSYLLESHTTKISILQKNGVSQSFLLKRNNNQSDFEKLDSSITSIGYNANGKSNFMKIDVGKGDILVSCEPFIFTNYHLLDSNNYEYLQLAGNYLDNKPLVWDEYYKLSNLVMSTSPLRYVLNNPNLRMAWYLLLIALFTYLFFGSRRQQRMIPIMPVPKNTSLEFAQTLGDLYFQNGNHLELVKKKMQHFKAFLNQHYQMETEDGEFLHKIAAKSGIPLKEVTHIFKTYQWISTQTSISYVEMNRFVGMINQFYKKCQ